MLNKFGEKKKRDQHIKLNENFLPYANDPNSHFGEFTSKSE